MAKKRKPNHTKTPKQPAPIVTEVSSTLERPSAPVDDKQMEAGTVNEYPINDVQTPNATGDYAGSPRTVNAASPEIPDIIIRSSEADHCVESNASAHEAVESAIAEPRQAVDEPVPAGTETVKQDHPNDVNQSNENVAHDTLDISEIVELKKRMDDLLQEVVDEKRNYDSFVHRVSKRVDQVTAQRRKMENELEGLAVSIDRVLKEIESVKTNPDGFEKEVDVSAMRGPPLPTQDELFNIAWRNGHVKKSYTGYSQRYNSSRRYQSWA